MLEYLKYVFKVKMCFLFRPFQLNTFPALDLPLLMFSFLRGVVTGDDKGVSLW